MKVVRRYEELHRLYVYKQFAVPKYILLQHLK